MRIDLCVYGLVLSNKLEALVLLASSHVMFTFQLRPFSNSLESILVALALQAFYQFLQSSRVASQVAQLVYTCRLHQLMLLRRKLLGDSFVVWRLYASRESSPGSRYCHSCFLCGYLSYTIRTSHISLVWFASGFLQSSRRPA